MPGSQLTYSLTHSAQIEKPLCYSAESTLGTLVTASPTYTAVAVVGQISPKINIMEIPVRQIGSHYEYGRVTAGHAYTFSLNVNPFALPFLKYGSEPPNYTTPTGTQAESLSFLLQYKQALGTAQLVSHQQFYLGCKMNQLTLSVSSQGLLEATTDWIAREITVPVLTSANTLTTPTIPTFASITTPPISNIDSGNLPLTINSVAYAADNFTISWNNNLIAESFIGSGLIDALTTGAVEITGSFVTPIGQSLALETVMHDFPQTGVTAKFTFKTSTMVVTMTNFKFLDDDTPWSQGPTDTTKNTVNFSCSTATLATS